VATDIASNNNGNESRLLLGPTNNWRVPELELGKDQTGSGECCELCGKPLDQGKPFVTNSAGQRPMHISCPGGEEPAAIELRPTGRRWMHLLHSFVGG
jgi:hypothetical protein